MSAWSIRHPLPPIVTAAAIVVLGCISFSKLPVTRMPNVDVPGRRRSGQRLFSLPPCVL
jgi:multidrug efflux pump subunit AcrB